MLLRISVSNTKEFFQKALKNFKSFFCLTYQRLPKNRVSYSLAADNQSYEELEKFYSDFTEQWDSQKEKASKKKLVLSTPPEKEEVHNESIMEKREENNKGRQHGSSKNAVAIVREHRRNCMVEKKLMRELQMLEMSDVDHVLDIEEVLHYYSRLTCPFYLEVVDKFFMEIYTEFFNPAKPASPLT